MLTLKFLPGEQLASRVGHVDVSVVYFARAISQCKCSEADFLSMYLLILGADLANLVNAAAIYAAAEGDQSVTTRHLEFARDKILMGRFF